jgi:hypothetical protein
MVLSPELIEHAKKEVDIKQYYEPSEKVIPQHLLYKDFTASTKWGNLPKIIFYILLMDAYGTPSLKDLKGDLGYAIKRNSVQDAQASVASKAPSTDEP